ncbi:hypothetical protein Pan258_04090 [Symmachiella dynata]|nr:hypothetical protein Pan258_04090 [Symmachiella dynata]
MLGGLEPSCADGRETLTDGRTSGSASISLAARTFLSDRSHEIEGPSAGRAAANLSSHRAGSTGDYLKQNMTLNSSGTAGLTAFGQKSQTFAYLQTLNFRNLT